MQQAEARAQALTKQPGYKALLSELDELRLRNETLAAHVTVMAEAQKRDTWEEDEEFFGFPDESDDDEAG